jgi:hypothetical protein
VWVHGYLHPANVVVARGHRRRRRPVRRRPGVGPGAAWGLLPAGAAARFFAGYAEADEATVRRARGLAALTSVSWATCRASGRQFVISVVVLCAVVPRSAAWPRSRRVPAGICISIGHTADVRDGCADQGGEHCHRGVTPADSVNDELKGGGGRGLQPDRAIRSRRRRWRRPADSPAAVVRDRSRDHRDRPHSCSGDRHQILRLRATDKITASAHALRLLEIQDGPSLRLRVRRDPAAHR